MMTKVRIALCMIVGVAVTSCADAGEPELGQAVLELSLDVSDSVAFGDTLRARWVVINSGSARGMISDFVMRLDPAPGSKLRSNQIFCGIGMCVDAVPPRGAFVRELAHRLDHGHLAVPEPVSVTVTYRIPGGQLSATDTVWAYP